MTISREVFGTTQRWRDILRANPGLRENNLKVGMTIKLPAARPARAEANGARSER
jgi:phage tail protein X